MIDMIGVGPFITLPLIVSAMGGPQAMLGWVVGAVLAMCDGLVWAELGAAMPGSGGSYRFLREIYGRNVGPDDFLPLHLAALLQRPHVNRVGRDWFRRIRSLFGRASTPLRVARVGISFALLGALQFDG